MELVSARRTEGFAMKATQSNKMRNLKSHDAMQTNQSALVGEYLADIYGFQCYFVKCDVRQFSYTPYNGTI